MFFVLTCALLLLQAVKYHALNLTMLNQNAKAISLLTGILTQHQAVYGDRSPETINVVVHLGDAFLAAERYDVAASVLSKAWESVLKVLDVHSIGYDMLFMSYMQALFGAGDAKGADSLRKEAIKRGMAREHVEYVYMCAQTRHTSVG